MAEFLSVVESIREEDASVKKLFKEEGQGMHSLGRRTPEYMSKLAEAAVFVADVLNGKRPVQHLQEAMTTSDFPILFGDILDRQMLASYRETPQTYRQWARVKSVPDFRSVKRMYSDGADGGLDVVGEKGEYTHVTRDEGEYGYAVKKYGNVFDISWETLINDDLDVLKDQPERFGRAARRTEERFATSLIAASTGPDSTFFTSGRGNRINDVFGIPGLTAGFTAMAAMTDAGGEPVWNQPSVLMVPPALEISAMNVLNAVAIEYGASTDTQRMQVANWIKTRLSLVVNHYLPIIDTTKGATAWYLFASPNEGRGAVEVGFLRGHEDPEVFMKAPDAIKVGGGGDAFAGSFATDDIEYKVRHVIGGTTLDYRYALASEGDGA